jgi:hypothetical protein
MSEGRRSKGRERWEEGKEISRDMGDENERDLYLIFPSFPASFRRVGRDIEKGRSTEGAQSV